jgi:hypothetical protein
VNNVWEGLVGNKMGKSRLRAKFAALCAKRKRRMYELAGFNYLVMESETYGVVLGVRRILVDNQTIIPSHQRIPVNTTVKLNECGARTMTPPFIFNATYHLSSADLIIVDAWSLLLRTCVLQ